MRTPRETPSPAFDQIMTGHFRRSDHYSTWRPRGTNDWLLIYTVSGHGQFRDASKQSVITGAGDCALLKPRVTHDYRTAQRGGSWDLLWAHFRPRPMWIELLNWPEAAPGIMLLSAAAAARKALALRLADMNRLAGSAHRRREDLAMNALEDVLLRCDTFNPRSAEAAIDPRILQAMNYLCANLDRQVDLSELAEVIGLSESRFWHLFRAQAGVTPRVFWRHIA